MNTRLSIIAAVAVLLSACAGMGIGPSKDPTKNLKEGRDLLRAPARAAAAERLIWESLVQFREMKNDAGEADACLAYAKVLTSPAVANKEQYFRQHGFHDTSVTLENRLEKSVAYLDKATPLLFEGKRYDALTEASTLRGVALMNLGKRDDACASFDQGLSFHDEQMRRNPSAKPWVPEGYGSWKEYMGKLQKWAGCAE